MKFLSKIAHRIARKRGKHPTRKKKMQYGGKSRREGPVSKSHKFFRIKRREVGAGERGGVWGPGKKLRGVGETRKENQVLSRFLATQRLAPDGEAEAVGRGKREMSGGTRRAV